MKKQTIGNLFGAAIKRSMLAIAMATGLGVGSSQALTITQTFNLGAQNSGTSISTDIGGLIPWIAKGTLPVGSIVRSVSASVRLDSSTSDSWTSDLLIYFDGTPASPGTAALLQIGGDYSGNLGTVSQMDGWTGGDDGPGTLITETKTAGSSWTGNIDLNAVQLSIGNNYALSSWSGTLTVEYDVTTLTAQLTSPLANQEYPSGQPVTVSANVFDPGLTLTDTVTFHTTPVSPSGSVVHTVSSATSSPFEADLGVLPAGTYEIYATVANDAAIPQTASSATRTFTVAPAIPTTTTLVSSANPSTYGQLTVTATVSPVPTGGTVQFYDGFDYLGSPVVVNTSTGTAVLTLNTRNAGTHEITAEYNGYQIYMTSSTLTALSQVVNQAPLTVKALGTLRAPNTANPSPFPYQISGYQNGQTLATSGVLGVPALSTSAILSSPAGNYVVNCALGSLDAANYSFTFVNGTLTVANMVDTFSVNFYAQANTSEEHKTNNLLVPANVPAGLGEFFTTGWTNVDAPFSFPTPTTQTLTSNIGSSAQFILKDMRNGWVYKDTRTTLLGDGNGNMMDGHVNSTLLADGGSNKFDMEMTGIPFAVYDVIFYLGANQDQFGDGMGVIKFKGGADRPFKLKPGRFDGTFTEMVDATTEGNYIVFRNVTGSSFTAQTWGLGPNDFNHVGPFGFQIRKVASYSTWATDNALSQNPSLDADNDGVANGIEYFMGQTGSAFTALPVLDATNKITWTKDPAYNGTWQVQTSSSLTAWDNVVGTDNGTSVSYTLPTGMGKLFVRLLVTPTP